MATTTPEIKMLPDDTDNKLFRREQLAQWVTAILSNEHSSPFKPDHISEGTSVSLQKISGDAGFRNYYRIQNPWGSMIAVDAPLATENTRAFVDIANRWRAGGIHVPKVFAVDYEYGFMLLEDLGDTQMQKLLQSSDATHYYDKLLETLLLVQQQQTDKLPNYNEKLIRNELSLYRQWFLEELLGIDTKSVKVIDSLNNLFSFLVSKFLEQPTGAVHRDYHSRNLMLTPEGTVGVIDFQDALNGPLLYDLVSLLRDCYISLTEKKVAQLLTRFISNHPVLSNYDQTCLQTWFDLTGIQRHLKCLGIFSRLWLRDGKVDYLNEIPRTFRYVLTICQQYNQCQEHATWLQTHIEPLIHKRLNLAREDGV